MNTPGLTTLLVAAALPVAAETITFDDASPAWVKAFWMLQTSPLGPVSLVVNNASSLGPTPLPQLADLDPAALPEVIGINLVAPFRLIQSVLGSMRMAGAGVIVNVPLA